MMFFAIRCAPVIYQVFTYEWLATVGTAGRYLLEKALGMIRHALMQVKTSIVYGFITSSAQEVLGMPGGSQGVNIVSPDGLFTLLANWMR